MASGLVVHDVPELLKHLHGLLSGDVGDPSHGQTVTSPTNTSSAFGILNLPRFFST